MSSHTHSNKAQMEANRRWLAKHPEKKAEYNRRKREKRKARIESDAAYAEQERAKKRRREGIWRDANRLAYQQKMHRYYIENIDYLTETSRERRKKLVCRMIFDAAFYAEWRKRGRIRKAKKCIMSGKVYRPQFNRRIPDWCTRGSGILDERSRFIFDGITPSDIGWVKDTMWERSEKRK